MAASGIKIWVWARRVSQLAFLGFFVYVLWSTTYPLQGKIPSGCLFQIDPLLMFFTSISERVLLGGVWVSAGLLLLSLVFGRFFCGWVCPLGTMSDCVAAANPRKGTLPQKVSRGIRKVKYLLLGAVALCAALGVQIAWVFDPLVIAGRFVSMNLIPAVTWAVERACVFLIQRFDLYDGPFYAGYSALKRSFLGVKVYYFSNAGVILLYILLIFAGALLFSRLWCRMLCPLGAMFALASRKALMERQVAGCNRCGICKSRCRMAAIHEGEHYDRSECVLCMDCVYDCPEKGTRFGWRKRRTGTRAPVPGEKPSEKGGVTRKEFLWLLFASLSVWVMGKYAFRKDAAPGPRKVIRPPGALPEKDFVDRCVRCGNCMKVCPTNGLQPVMMESGAEGVWTPRLVPEIGYCEYSCSQCGQVCPTGAIPELRLDEKQKMKLGLARIDRSLCYPWAKHKNCLVCEEHCPVPDKAIKIIEGFHGDKKVLKPVVDPGLCVGCGICEKVCPAPLRRAIVVAPL